MASAGCQYSAMAYQSANNWRQYQGMAKAIWQPASSNIWLSANRVMAPGESYSAS